MMCRPKPRSRAPVFLSRKRPLGDAADVALLADAGLQGVGVDLDVVVGFADLDLAFGLGGQGGLGEQGEQNSSGKRSHENTSRSAMRMRIRVA